MIRLVLALFVLFVVYSLAVLVLSVLMMVAALAVLVLAVRATAWCVSRGMSWYRTRHG